VVAVLMVLGLSILGAVVLAAMGWLIASADDGLRPADPAQPDLGPVDRPLHADDVPRLRFRLAFRGYRMSDVDTALERLGQALAQAEADLRTEREAVDPVPGGGERG
jgi:DivIVA domain-containing protein